MGRVLLVFRLVLGDLRRHPGPAVLLVLSTLVATAVLSLGMSLPGATERLYLQTRAATAGPDVVAIAPGLSRAADTALTSLENVPGVAARSRTYRTFFTTITTDRGAVRAAVFGADAKPGPIDRPLVTSGVWVRPGGAVVERGFADALRLRVGDHVTIGGRSFPIVGVAVTAARPVYPWATMGGPDGGPSDRSGLVWLHERDTRALAEADVPAASLVYLRLRDPAATAAFRAVYHEAHDPAIRVNSFTWPVIAFQDSVYLRDGQPILIVGGWLLSFLAVAGLSTLAAGRVAGQTHRAGLLRVVGATPGLIAVVLLTEYLALALLADAAGLAVTRLVAPLVVNPSGSLLTTDAGPSGPVAAMTTVAAVGVAILTAVAPAVRALRTDAVATLSPAARRPDHLVLLSRLAGLLPVPLLLGLRLVARRPGRALLHAAGTATTALGLTVLLMVEAQPDQGWDFGGVTVADLMDDRSRLLLLGVIAAMVALAVVNTLTMTWTTAKESRATMAVARTLGATPGQVAAGLATAQLLPALPGALAGIPLGLFAQWLFGHQNAPQSATPSLWLVPPALLLVTAVLAAVPARVSARRSVAETLRAETA
ncbi:FtsX-like permease family protein [Herbidospora galbida]|uniref:FtsX-like permease family protein n=1 Tax=Herbidospora galbida TaxID=2575442 RepID=A0A4U3MLE9_9ACTN|nr:FtsX-like permease family protein [Herbidospora galbida]TKK89364.1 FtsX-like permease family protein [Herbidospora galbida]